MDTEGKPFSNIPECQNTNKKLRKQDDTTEQDTDQDGQNAKAVGARYLKLSQNIHPLREFFVWMPQLKIFNIYARYLQKSVLRDGCQDTVKATITAPNQLCFTFIGHLRSMNNISVEAPSLSEVRIQLRDSVALFVRDVEALNFPEDFTKTCSSPLRNVKELEVRILSPSGARDSDSRDCLVWMAPSASIPPVKYSRDISPT